MKNIIYGLSIAGVVLFSNISFARETLPCEKANFLLNSVETFKKYDHGGVKVFELDTIEPAAASINVAITIDHGNDLASYESFCRYIPYLQSADVKNAKSHYDKATGILTVDIDATEASESDSKGPFTLSLTINKKSKDVNQLVTFEILKK